MAHRVMLRHPVTGVTKDGLYGFSWTIFFFGGWPILFRGEILLGVVVIILAYVTFGIAGFILAFFYNKHYTIRLLEKGYELADNENINAIARGKLGIVDPRHLPHRPAELN